MVHDEAKVRFVSWTQFGQLLGAFSIAASLFLVAWEMKQARDIAEAELHLGRADFDAKGYLELDQVKIGQATDRLKAVGEAGLSDDEWYLLVGYYHFLSLSADTAHFHWQKGLLDEGVWLAYLEAYAVSCNVKKNAFREKVWNQGYGYRKDFAKVMNDFLAEKEKDCFESAKRAALEPTPSTKKEAPAP